MRNAENMVADFAEVGRSTRREVGSLTGKLTIIKGNTLALVDSGGEEIDLNTRHQAMLSACALDLVKADGYAYTYDTGKALISCVVLNGEKAVICDPYLKYGDSVVFGNQYKMEPCDDLSQNLFDLDYKEALPKEAIKKIKEAINGTI